MTSIWLVINDTLWLLYDKLEKYIKYSLVGMIGVLIHFSLLYLLTEKAGLWYILSATIAIGCAATNNYILNYFWTFKERKKVITSWWIGWFKFLLSIGMTEILYLGLLYWFTEKFQIYYLVSAFIALSLTTVIRYFTAEKWIWKKSKNINIIS